MLLVCACVLDVNMHTLYFVELFIVIRTLSQLSGAQHWISKLLAKTNQLSTQLPTMLHSIVPVLKVSSKKQPCYLYNVVLYVCVRQNERAREREGERDSIIWFAYKNTAATYLGQLWWTTLFSALFTPRLIYSYILIWNNTIKTLNPCLISLFIISFKCLMCLKLS